MSALSRRTVMAAAAAIPLAGVPACAVAQGPTPIESALAGRRAAVIAYRSFDSLHHTPALDAFREASAALPHHLTAASFENVGGERVSLSTENEASVAVARKVLADHEAGVLRSGDADYLATLRELTAAADDRADRVKALRVKHRLDRLGEMADWFAAREARANAAVIDAPITSPADLLLKLEFIEDLDMWDAGGSEALMADARSMRHIEFVERAA